MQQDNIENTKSLQFYKPSRSLNGHAIGFSFNSKKGKMYVNFIKQTAEKSFKGGKQFAVSFGIAELGSWLNVIERNVSRKLFHQSEKGNTSIELKPYSRIDKETQEKIKDGFTISVNPRSNSETEERTSFSFWFSADEARAIKEYLQFVLSHFYQAIYAADKKRAENYIKNKTSQPAKEQTSPQKDESEQNDEEDPFA